MITLIVLVLQFLITYYNPNKMLPYIKLDNYAVGVPFIILVVITFVIAQAIVRRYFRKEQIEACHQVGGTMIVVMGTLYAVTLSLIVLDAMAKFDRAEAIILNESQSLLVVFELSEQFKNQDKGEEIKHLTEEYIHQVIVNDWELMSENVFNYKAHDILRELINVVKKIEPKTENEKQVLPVLLQEVISVWKYRVARVNQSQYRIPQVEWVLLLIGGVVTIGFTYFFRIESQIIQSLMTGLFTLIIAMNLYMVLLFSEPYAGNFQVSKRSLITIQAVMRGIYFDKSSKD